MRRYVGGIAIGGALAVIVVASLAIWLTVDSPSGVDAAVLAQRAKAQSEALADQLLPGKALHIRYERYRRHGDAATRIEADPRFYPERYYVDTWHDVGLDGKVVSDRWVTVGLDGAMYAKGWTENGQLFHEFPRAGIRESDPFTSYSARGWVQGLSAFVDTLPGKGFRYVEKGLWDDGRETAIFERSSPIQLRPREPGQTGFSVPYVEDLEPKELLERFELVLENPLTNHNQRWAVDAQGTKTLVEVTKTLVLEVVDSSAGPN